MERLKLSTASRGQNQTSLASSVSFSFPAAAQPLLTPKQPISAACVTKRQLEMLHRNTSTCRTCSHPPAPQCCRPGFHCSPLMRLRRWGTDVPIGSYISPSSFVEEAGCWPCRSQGTRLSYLQVDWLHLQGIQRHGWATLVLETSP